MVLIDPQRAFRALKQTHLILEHELRGLTQEKAAQTKDGPNGWSIVEVVCHLCDFEEIYYERLQLVMAEDCPTVPLYNQEELAVKNDYAHQDLRATLKTLTERRQRLVDWLSTLSAADLQRKGIHPTSGEFDIAGTAINIALHDINHIEQITHTLDRA
jgi:uncharacterized damage-inducible protein DinB